MQFMKGDLSELYTELGKEVLPEEYGGDNGTFAEIEGMSFFLKLQVILTWPNLGLIHCTYEWHIFSIEKVFKLQVVWNKFKTINPWGCFQHLIGLILGNWRETVMKNKEWFKEQMKFKSEEEKQLGKPKTHADIFGIEGSFRKLDID